MGSLPLLPIELIDRIIKILADDGAKTRLSDVKNCALVCHAWLFLCRPHIFHDINIGEQYHEGQWMLSETAHRLFHVESPHLCPYIRRLRIASPLDNWTCKQSHLEDLFLRIFERAVRLHSIRLQNSLNQAWSELPVSLSSSLIHLVSLPTLTTLSLSGWCFSHDIMDFALILASCAKTLRCLSLIDVAHDSTPSSEASQSKRIETPVHLTTLHHLELDEQFYPNAFNAPIEVPNLSSLLVRFSASRQWTLPPYVPPCLVNLVLVTGVGESPLIVLDIRRLSQLRNMRIIVSAASNASYPSLFHWICQSIDSLPSPNPLHSIEIQISARHHTTPSSSDWTPLGDLLDQLKDKGSLRSVSLSFRIKSTAPRDISRKAAEAVMKEIRSQIRGGLRNLDEAGCSQGSSRVRSGLLLCVWGISTSQILTKKCMLNVHNYLQLRLTSVVAALRAVLTEGGYPQRS